LETQEGFRFTGMEAGNPKKLDTRAFFHLKSSIKGIRREETPTGLIEILENDVRDEATG